MGSSSGNHIKVTLHKTELAIHVHKKKDVKRSNSKNVGVCRKIDSAVLGIIVKNIKLIKI
jgi:hypothetical protein